jgi:nucleoside-diphosphate-sugar epimerase
MRVLVTGACGKVGAHVARALRADAAFADGVYTTDLARGVYDTPSDAQPASAALYWQADLCDAGAVYALIARAKPDVVVHVAAIPDPSHTPPGVVFTNNISSTFNVVEACVRMGVARLVNISSETVPGFFFPERVLPGVSGQPLFCPVDETHPIAPQDPYALSKHFGEQLCDAAVRRAPGLSVVTIRPSWCQDAANIGRNLGPLIRDPSLPQPGMWSYVIIHDLAAAVKAAAHHFGAVEVRALDRPDASGISCAKARRLLGWEPKLTWRNFLDAQGHPLAKE